MALGVIDVVAHDEVAAGGYEGGVAGIEVVLGFELGFGGKGGDDLALWSGDTWACSLTHLAILPSANLVPPK